MSQFEDLQPHAAIRGILPDCLVTVVGTQWFSSEALELTYKTPAGRYRGLRRGGQHVNVSGDKVSGLQVSPERAEKQCDADAAAAAGASIAVSPGSHTNASSTAPLADGAAGGLVVSQKPTRYHGIVVLNSGRVGRDAGRPADEVVSHLSGLVGAEVTVTLEVDAEDSQRRFGSRRAERLGERPDAEVHPATGLRRNDTVPRQYERLDFLFQWTLATPDIYHLSFNARRRHRF